MKQPAKELQGLYDRWHELTREETVAIRAERWSGVAELQHQKAELQAQVERLSSLPAVDPWPVAGLAPLIRELLALETENARLMEGKLAVRRQQQAELDRSGNNLRRLRGSYGQGRATTWQSYS